MNDSISYDVGDRVRFRTGHAVWTVEDVGGANLDLVLCRSERGKVRWVDSARIRPVDTTEGGPAESTGPRVEYLQNGWCTVDGRPVRQCDAFHTTTVEWNVPAGDGTWSDPSAVMASAHRDRQQRTWVYLSLAGGYVEDRDSWEVAETRYRDPEDFIDDDESDDETATRWRTRMQRPTKKVALGKQAAIELAAELMRLSTYLDD